MIFDVSFSHAVESATEAEAVQKAAAYFLNDSNATAMVGPHVGHAWGQSLDTIIRLRDGVKSQIPEQARESWMKIVEPYARAMKEQAPDKSCSACGGAGKWMERNDEGLHAGTRLCPACNGTGKAPR